MVAETPNNGSRSILHFYLRSRVVTLEISFETGLSVCLGLYEMLRVNGGDLEIGAGEFRLRGHVFAVAGFKFALDQESLPGTSPAQRNCRARVSALAQRMHFRRPAIRTCLCFAPWPR